MAEKYSYIRVSDMDQHPDRQLSALKKYWPDIPEENIFIEKASGKKGVNDRQEYAVLRRILRAGDELFIDSLDRLGRKKADIKNELEYLKNKGVIVRVSTMPTTLIDIDGQAWVIEMINNLLIEVYASLAEQELSEKERRQMAGIEEAKKRGVYKGRKPIEYDKAKFKDLYYRWKKGAIKAKEFMELIGLKPNTFYRAVQRFEIEEGIEEIEEVVINN